MFSPAKSHPLYGGRDPMPIGSTGA